jgi:hypothetical protein
MSAGKVRRRRWVHEGVKREAWGFTPTTAKRRSRKSRLPHEGRGPGGAVLIRWPGRLRPVHCYALKSVEELIGASLTKRRG